MVAGTWTRARSSCERSVTGFVRAGRTSCTSAKSTTMPSNPVPSESRNVAMPASYPGRVAAHARVEFDLISSPRQAVSRYNMCMLPVFAQAVVERGMLDSMSARIAGVRYEIDARLGDGATTWLLVGLVVVVLFWTLRRR